MVVWEDIVTRDTRHVVLVIGNQGRSHVARLMQILESLGCQVVVADRVRKWVLPLLDGCGVSLIFCDIDSAPAGFSQRAEVVKSKGVTAKMVALSRLGIMSEDLEPVGGGATSSTCPPADQSQVADLLSSTGWHPSADINRLAPASR